MQRDRDSLNQKPVQRRIMDDFLRMLKSDPEFIADYKNLYPASQVDSPPRCLRRRFTDGEDESQSMRFRCDGNQLI